MASLRPGIHQGILGKKEFQSWEVGGLGSKEVWWSMGSDSFNHERLFLSIEGSCTGIAITF